MKPIGHLNRLKMRIYVRHLNSVATLQQQQCTSINNTSSKYKFLSLTATCRRMLNHTNNIQQTYSICSSYSSSHSFLSYLPFRYYMTINNDRDHNRPDHAVPESDLTDYETERKNFNIHVQKFYNFCTDIIDKWAATEKKVRKNI